MPQEDRSSSLCVVRIQTISTVLYMLSNFFTKGGVGRNDVWPPSVGNSWRTTTDIQDYWISMINNIDFVRLCYISHI
jgi:hypothetical protein